MSKMVFLYKENTNDRDRVAYIKAKPMRWECNHYFGSINLEGPCYSGKDFASYDNIKTILTREEYEQLKKFDDDICALGFCINVGDERYQKGVALCEAIQPVYDKLLSEENEKLFQEIVEEECEFLQNEYSLSSEDIEHIFNEYRLPYRDASVIGAIFADVEEFGCEEAYSCGYVSKNSVVERYFDFERFGEDLLENGDYVELDDGRIVSLMY